MDTLCEGLWLNDSGTRDGCNSTGYTKNNVDPTGYVLAVERMELIGIPILVTIGLIGNTLSAVTFLSKNLRTLSCSLYLAARAVTDSGFLICLFIIWLQYIGVPIIHTDGVCQVEIFTSYLCGFLSVWFIVWVSLENYYRICQPFKVSTFCTMKKAISKILFTILFGCVVYSFSTWTNGIVERFGKPKCYIKRRFNTINTVLVYSDCAITLIVPFTIILVVTGRILLSIIKTHGNKALGKRRGSIKLKATVSKMLFWVCLIFLLLNLPSHSVRLRGLFEMITRNSTTVTPLLYLSQRILQMFFYMSFAINFFIYISLGPSFRNSFKVLFCRSCARHRPNTLSRPMAEDRNCTNSTSLTTMSIRLLKEDRDECEAVDEM